MTDPNPRSVSDMGALWVPFGVEFDTQEGRFTFELWAVDLAHAHDRLSELKATAKIYGEIHAQVRA